VGSHVVVVANGLVEDEQKLSKCVGGPLDQELLQGPVPAFTLWNADLDNLVPSFSSLKTRFFERV
jgi:hypothetical protein